MIRLLADPDGGALPALKESDAVQWAVGPEGGFTEAETASFMAAGFKPVRFGRSILRFDTAAVAALALTAQARLGPLQQGNGR
jgi:16S rRNA (uracil1498-N3)-methyltransferase